MKVTGIISASNSESSNFPQNRLLLLCLFLTPKVENDEKSNECITYSYLHMQLFNSCNHKRQYPIFPPANRTFI
ncbi:hypothetical protein HMPREF9447_01028 [Bacteroides oleiciplenus YIT 12058]|uniref:Uncharacterized protein n=1 Tax=Bacteroides oleiciplenus YIT 12058 TaxID=742727 RepID=K9EKY2_9BACE|nr:hypothetical protein HMPREF9447_01028 [Bacteroides oleiciplenus YIT 12058]